MKNTNVSTVALVLGALISSTIATSRTITREEWQSRPIFDYDAPLEENWVKPICFKGPSTTMKSFRAGDGVVMLELNSDSDQKRVSIASTGKRGAYYIAQDVDTGNWLGEVPILVGEVHLLDGVEKIDLFLKKKAGPAPPAAGSEELSGKSLPQLST
ncbi:hypothetical protein PGT21_008773 [Puccinia graminis f. sp. tritici]|uniref:Uncharacterized protein n=1 Tax=Puccinia graminis f. sp. tritici TaxID=56615 RepID=A0A5B0LT48_PUCGR|nr:hypothetical protein PGT21_008773 [Puccinia graminis f. sp. tritici]KAA1092207.1 hypothetical protein PGTUg99_021500 [Puccinia graminis f. sp. tritici]